MLYTALNYEGNFCVSILPVEIHRIADNFGSTSFSDFGRLSPHFYTKGAIFISKHVCVHCVFVLSCSLFADRVVKIDEDTKKTVLEQVELFDKHKHVC